MHPTLPFGPASLPTAPILAILAVLVTLEIASRYGRKLGLHPDDVWNTALIGLAAGLIVARVWNVFQFWHIYRVEPSLIFSLRPSGFEFWPGVIAAFIGGYAYLLYRALDPVRIGAPLAVGMLAALPCKPSPAIHRRHPRPRLYRFLGHNPTSGIPPPRRPLSCAGLGAPQPWRSGYMARANIPTVLLLAVLGYSLMRLFCRRLS